MLDINPIDEKHKKLLRKAESANDKFTHLLVTGIWTEDELDKAQDKFLKAFNELIVYPRKIDWGKDPNGGILI